MKTQEEILNARKQIIRQLIRPELDSHQTMMLMGMVNALCWVMDDPNGNTTKDIVDGKQLQATTLSPKVYEALRSMFNAMHNAIQQAEPDSN